MFARKQSSFISARPDSSGPWSEKMRVNMLLLARSSTWLMNMFQRKPGGGKVAEARTASHRQHLHQCLHFAVRERKPYWISMLKMSFMLQSSGKLFKTTLIELFRIVHVL